MREANDFVLHPRLAADTFAVGDLAVSRVLIMDDARFPWLILAPRRAGLSEWHEMTPADRDAVSAEMFTVNNLWMMIAAVSEAMKILTDADKMNIAALGNIVPQLHVHIVARRNGDAGWPGPVWGSGAREPYGPDAAGSFREAVRAALNIGSAD